MTSAYWQCAKCGALHAKEDTRRRTAEKFIRFAGGETVFASRFDGSGYDTTEPLHITIKSENLKPGLFDFIARAKDALAQSDTLRKTTFRIAEKGQGSDRVGSEFRPMECVV